MLYICFEISDFSVWCYACNAYLNVQLIPQPRSLYETACRVKSTETLPFLTDEHIEDGQADGTSPELNSVAVNIDLFLLIFLFDVEGCLNLQVVILKGIIKERERSDEGRSKKKKVA